MRALKRINIGDILFFDIETSYLKKDLKIDSPLFDSWVYKMGKNGESNEELVERYYNEAALYSEFGRIVCISVGMYKGGKINTSTYNNLDEGQLIKDFYECLDKLKKDAIICGHAIKSFDMPYVIHRGIAHNLPPHELMDVSGLKPWEVDWVLDTKELWQGTGWNRASLLGITTLMNLPSPKSGITGKEVPAYFWKDPKGNIVEISEYCERDVEATYEVVNYLKNLGKEKEVPKGMLQELFDGGSYTKKVKEKLLNILLDSDKAGQEKIFKVLDSIVSTAKGKKTKLTKAHVKALKVEVNYG